MNKDLFKNNMGAKKPSPLSDEAMVKCQHILTRALQVQREHFNNLTNGLSATQIKIIKDISNPDNSCNQESGD